MLLETLAAALPSSLGFVAYAGGLGGGIKNGSAVLQVFLALE
jgi:hypothetical protein